MQIDETSSIEPEWKVQTPSPQRFVVQKGNTNFIDFDLLPGLHHLTSAQRNNLVYSMFRWFVRRVESFEKTKIVIIKNGALAIQEGVPSSELILMTYISIDDSGFTRPVRILSGKRLEYWDGGGAWYACPDGGGAWYACPDGVYTLDSTGTLWRRTNAVTVVDGKIVDGRLEKVNRVILVEGNY